MPAKTAPYGVVIASHATLNSIQLKEKSFVEMYGSAKVNHSLNIGFNSSKLRSGCNPFQYLARSKIFLFLCPSPVGTSFAGIATEEAKETEELHSVTSDPSVALEQVR